MARLSAVILCSLALASPARAQQPPVDTSALAKQHYEAGMGHFQLEEWDAAIEEWKEGFRIKPVAEFLYNIAQAYRLSKRNEQAVSFYQKYLRVEPKAPNRPEVERHIAQLSKLIDAQAKAQSAPPIQPLPTSTTTTTPPPVKPELARVQPEVRKMPTETRVQEPVREPPPPPPRQPVVVETPPPPVSSSAVAIRATPQPETPIYKKGWFWGVMGGVAAVVVGAVVVGVIVGGGGGDSTKILPMARF